MLCQHGAVINLVFHDIAENTAQAWTSYDVTAAALAQIVDRLIGHGLAPQVRLYFDDNRRSLYDLALPQVPVTAFREVVAAIPVTTIGRAGYGSRADLRAAAECGVRIAAHGVSHIRLAHYDRYGTVLDTPLGGPYADRPAHDRHQRLTENEVLFQLSEARDHFTGLGDDCHEFVLPHGCYNATTLALNQRLGLYEVLATADSGLDIGQHLRPRLTVTGTDSADTVIARIFEEVRPPCLPPSA
ncbi:hypothetical protein CRH09_31570 [Nocardia terpenica]|uniref:NodB homology domain-containing protein n=1 Tax=Nocardia terpenica TaxID=455432 RepID=A0A291RRF0_9NOCA|nr:hypothetical protein CRH09_31570 [Nocardia terpenica]